VGGGGACQRRDDVLEILCCSRCVALAPDTDPVGLHNPETAEVSGRQNARDVE
jgi:hypothetical protein